MPNLTMGPSTKDIQFFGPFFDLPTYPYPIFSLWNDYFSLAISDFHKPTYLPKDRISFLDDPYGKALMTTFDISMISMFPLMIMSGFISNYCILKYEMN